MVDKPAAAEPAPKSSAPLAKTPTYGATTKPRGGFELFSWYFFRISGVLLIFLALIHLAIMHVSNDVSQTVYDFVATRYSNPFWRVYDLLLLTLALLHGLNGLRIAIDDYVRPRGWRLLAQSTVWTIALAWWLMGMMTIITFQPGHTNVVLHFLGLQK